MDAVVVGCATALFLLCYVPIFAKGPYLFDLAKSQANMGMDELNMNPRVALDKTMAKVATLDPKMAAFLARCQNTHQNQVEGLAWLLGAFIFAALAGVPARTVDIVAMYCTCVRGIYVYAYITGDVAWKSYLRSFCFWSSWVAALYLYITACVTAPARSWS